MTIVLSGAGLTIEHLVAIARQGARVEISERTRARIADMRAHIERLAESGAAMGAGAGAGLDMSELAAHQRRAIRARAVGMGPPLPTATVRAMMVARAAGLAAGGSGASPDVLDALVAALNGGLSPVVPSLGSAGAGDQAPLAHLALALIGEGAAEIGGAIQTGMAGLEAAGLVPLILGPMDGRALTGANALSVGQGALVLADAQIALAAMDAAAALSLEGLRGNLAMLDPRVQAARPAPGQGAAADRLRALLEGSALWREGVARRPQDPAGFRGVAPAHGAVLWALAEARRAVEIELNAAGDDPLVLDEEMVSTGNLQMPQFALAFETLGLALAQACRLSVERTGRLMLPAASGLPMGLSPRGPSRSGFGALQRTAARIFSEIRRLAQPAFLDGPAMPDAMEDHAAMAQGVIAKTEAMLAHVFRLSAIEMMVAAQAIDLRHPLPLGGGLRAAYDRVRSISPYLDEDRPTGPDAQRLADLLRSGAP